MEITFLKQNLHPVFAKNTFFFSRFVSIKNGEKQPTGAYKDYKLVEINDKFWADNLK